MSLLSWSEKLLKVAIIRILLVNDIPVKGSYVTNLLDQE